MTSRRRRRQAHASETFNIIIWALLIVSIGVLALAVWTTYWRPSGPTKIIAPITRNN